MTTLDVSREIICRTLSPQIFDIQSVFTQKVLLCLVCRETLCHLSPLSPDADHSSMAAFSVCVCCVVLKERGELLKLVVIVVVVVVVVIVVMGIVITGKSDAFSFANERHTQEFYRSLMPTLSVPTLLPCMLYQKVRQWPVMDGCTTSLTRIDEWSK